eukprot:13765396-Alexandrium_andersonii.AAC.1
MFWSSSLSPLLVCWVCGGICDVLPFTVGGPCGVELDSNRAVGACQLNARRCSGFARRATDMRYGQTQH